MLQLCKLSNTGSKPTCLVFRTIFKHDPTSHLATARASDSVIYSDIASVISLRIIIIIIIIINIIIADVHTALLIKGSAWEYIDDVGIKVSCYLRIFSGVFKILNSHTLTSFAGEFRNLTDVNFVCAMGPPGGGRNPITPRIMRHFNYLAFTELEDASKAKIFTTIVNCWLRKCVIFLYFITVNS